MCPSLVALAPEVEQPRRCVTGRRRPATSGEVSSTSPAVAGSDLQVVDGLEQPLPVGDISVGAGGLAEEVLLCVEGLAAAWATDPHGLDKSVVLAEAHEDGGQYPSDRGEGDALVDPRLPSGGGAFCGAGGVVLLAPCLAALRAESSRAHAGHPQGAAPRRAARGSTCHGRSSRFSFSCDEQAVECARTGMRKSVVPERGREVAPPLASLGDDQPDRLLPRCGDVGEPAEDAMCPYRANGAASVMTTGRSTPGAADECVGDSRSRSEGQLWSTSVASPRASTDPGVEASAASTASQGTSCLLGAVPQ